MRYRQTSLITALSVATGLALLSGCNKPAEPPRPAPPNVVTSEVKSETIPLIVPVPGTVESKKVVQIIPRVTGYVFERNFIEGTIVDEGASLYVIDPRPYQAELDSLNAQLLKDQANLKYWTDEATRYAILLKQKNVSKEDAEKTVTNREEARAAVEQDKANIENARLNLSFTEINAPFSGRVQNTMKHVGDLVNAQETVLTSLIQMDPIYVVTNVSRQQFYEIQKLREQGLTPSRQSDLKARLVLPDGETYEHEGSLNYVSSQIDPNTDTLTARYEFKNAGYQDTFSLIPGQYVPMNMVIGHKPDALLIPEKALQQTQEGEIVYIVDSQGKARKKIVETSGIYKQQWIISKGLKAGDKVIVDGLLKIKPGMEVKVTRGKSASTAGKSSPKG